MIASVLSVVDGTLFPDEVFCWEELTGSVDLTGCVGVVGCSVRLEVGDSIGFAEAVAVEIAVGFSEVVSVGGSVGVTASSVHLA